MKTGELTHRGQAAVDNENFEPVKADTFEGLGLPKSLADHLEGNNLLSQFSRCVSVLYHDPESTRHSTTTERAVIWLAELNFTSPTRVQQQAIPRLLVRPSGLPHDLKHPSNQ